MLPDRGRLVPTEGAADVVEIGAILNHALAAFDGELADHDPDHPQVAGRQADVEQAEDEVKAYLAQQADQVDENTVVMLEDENELALGASIFINKCAVCHGNEGQGGVGPNMTDNYFIHGGTINDVFKTIKYGVPEKGMISWKSQLRSSDMQRVASYILTLVGTTPANPKAPEGELYQPAEEGATDAVADDQIGMNE